MNLSIGSHGVDVNRWNQRFDRLGVINGWHFLKENSKTHSRRYINELIINSKSNRWNQLLEKLGKKMV